MKEFTKIELPNGQELGVCDAKLNALNNVFCDIYGGVGGELVPSILESFALAMQNTNKDSIVYKDEAGRSLYTDKREPIVVSNSGGEIGLQIRHTNYTQSDLQYIRFCSNATFTNVRPSLAGDRILVYVNISSTSNGDYYFRVFDSRNPNISTGDIYYSSAPPATPKVAYSSIIKGDPTNLTIFIVEYSGTLSTVTAKIDGAAFKGLILFDEIKYGKTRDLRLARIVLSAPEDIMADGSAISLVFNTFLGAPSTVYQFKFAFSLSDGKVL